VALSKEIFLPGIKKHSVKYLALDKKPNSGNIERGWW
jgi:hypothetical protein